jgi:hypothetical protein
MFAPTSFWNQRQPAGAPLDPSSAAYVANLVKQGQETAFGFSFRDYGATLFIAAASTPLQKVTIDNQSNAYFDAMREAFAAVPIPPQARPAHPWPGDNPMCIYQPSTDTYWEGWKWSQFEVDGPHSGGQAEGVSAEILNAPGWHMESGAVYLNVSKNLGFFDDASWPPVAGKNYRWSSSASGLPLMGGCLRIAEAQRLYIPHALQFAIPAVQKTVFSYPASKTDGTSSDPTAPKEGMCFRLPATYDLSGIADPFVRAVCTAIRDFGLYLKDKGGSVAIQCESQATVPKSQAYGTDAWKGPADAFGSSGAIFTKYAGGPGSLGEMIPWKDLQVVDSSYRCSSVAPGMLPVGV